MMPRLRVNVRGVYVIWYRDVIRFWRARMRIVASLGQPVLFLLIFGNGLAASFSGPPTERLEGADTPRPDHLRSRSAASGSAGVGRRASLRGAGHRGRRLRR